MLVSGKIDNKMIHVLLDTGATKSIVNHQLALQHTWTRKPVNETIITFDQREQQISNSLEVPLQLGGYQETLQ
jgi:hypothetical protein